jgi:N-methylhydantoinase B
VSDSKFTRITLCEGDEVVLSSAGGGGFGSPEDRPRAEVLDDLRERFVSPEAARELYGVEDPGA